jgi:23S rRNA (cytidine1920-2'-O)/16S rRNA (cytidine1409-2'-O)-methyltransferase
MAKERLDKVMVGRGLAPTREKAQALIMAGLVSSGGGRLDKPGRLIPGDLPIEVEAPPPFVGRGGLKLEEALAAFRVDAAGAVCADIGSSTGGFTDCLLQRGAARVYAVDVDVRQIDARLRSDPRVVLVEKNARFLEPADLGGGGEGGGSNIDIVVMDVSFISILKILPALRAVCRPKRTDAGPGAAPPTVLLTLIKPQFEAGKGQVGPKGIVRDPARRAQILARVVADASALGYGLRGVVRCATRGRQGNQEFFARWTLGGLPPAEADVLEWVRTAALGEDPVRNDEIGT